MNNFPAHVYTLIMLLAYQLSQSEREISFWLYLEGRTLGPSQRPPRDAERIEVSNSVVRHDI